MALSIRQQKFVELYCNPESECFGNGTKAYIGAGYSKNKGSNASACKLLSTANICKAIEEYKHEQGIKQAYNKEIVQSRINKTWDMAVAKNDVMACIASARLQAQEQAMLTDKLHTSTDDAQKPQFDPEQIEQMLADAKYITDNKPNIKLMGNTTDAIKEQKQG